MSPWLRVVALAAIVSIVVSGCKGKDDEEDPREHRKQRVNAGGVTGSGSVGGVELSCPFGLCDGLGSSGEGPEQVCKRMSEIMAKESGPLKTPPPSAHDLEQCVVQMEKMRTDQPKQYAVMERCIDTAADMSALVACMTKMYLDGGVP